MSYHCYEVTAYIDLDVESIIEAVISEYGYASANDVRMDDIYEYVSDHITYLDKQWGGRGIRIVEDGPSISGFDSRTYDEIEQILESMQNWE